MKKLLLILAGLFYLASTSGSAVPPGLSKHGVYPQGLKNQGKTPYGWSRGKKTGWFNTHNLHPKKAMPVKKNLKIK